MDIQKERGEKTAESKAPAVMSNRVCGRPGLFRRLCFEEDTVMSLQEADPVCAV